MKHYHFRRTVIALIALLVVGTGFLGASVEMPTVSQLVGKSDAPVPADLAQLPVKGRAPKTGYQRSQFGSGWDSSLGCDTRNRILARDLTDIVYQGEGCKVQTGKLNDPYTGKLINFVRGETTSDDVQIDHVVALSNAWQTGAQQLHYETRVEFANDPLNLLAVDGPTNEKKSDGDAATWLPPHKPFRCQYVKRQIAVKHKYGLWLTRAEKEAMSRVLVAC